MCLVGLTSRCGPVCPLSGMSGGGSVSGPFPPSRDAPIPWPMAPPSIFKAHSSTLCLRIALPFLTLPPPSHQAPCGYTGPTGWSRTMPASHCCHGEQQGGDPGADAPRSPLLCLQAPAAMESARSGPGSGRGCPWDGHDVYHSFFLN